MGKYALVKPFTFAHSPDINRQQDSHEHFVFLLGRLHDDLNRIKGQHFESGVVQHEQFVQLSAVFEGRQIRPDNELAQAALKADTQINDSIIYDLFRGILTVILQVLTE